MPKTHELKDMYADLGVNTSDLGCIMLDTALFDVASSVPGGKDDLYFSSHPDSKYVQGDVVARKAHLTLLYGLLEKGPKWKAHVDRVLDGWTMPEYVEIESVGAFPSTNPDEDYTCIVAHIKVTPELSDGNGRLRMLPHIDGFAEYKPHVTLAYVRNDPANVDWARTTREKWLLALDGRLRGRMVPVLGLNYGGSSSE